MRCDQGSGADTEVVGASVIVVGLQMRVATVRCDRGSRAAIFLAVDIAMGSGANTEVVSAFRVVEGRMRLGTRQSSTFEVSSRW